MAKTKQKIDLSAELLSSVREMTAGVHARSYKIHVSEIVHARMLCGFTQSAFATLLGVSVRTLQDWEQGRREPSGAAKTLIKVAERHPEVLQELAA